ncbi:hypothetical protein O3M35_002367 [Rhynocoris fuscipes]|uniref:Uncharacterized protein n=1 Tax=Rhynocoris fuscipes TaxID=488301 RepID=A0AAW1CSR4_9HEMI
MREYEHLGHMREIKGDDLHIKPRYYIPHHPVFKESTTTQIRVVFDASSKPPDGNSLNASLLKGPVIQSDLFSIIVRFRMNKYTLTGDIAKMYRQILIEESHVNFQRIVWRETPDQLAQEYKDSCPLAAHIIENNFYMDDLMTGSDSYDELKTIQEQITNILQSGCFVLRKWCSNSKTLLKQISSDSDDPHHIINLDTCEGVKTLGLIWMPFLDTFEFNIKPIQHSHIISRRTILSELSRIFDPLGFLTPVIIKGKIFIQQLWLNNLGWDDPLTYDLTHKWISFSDHLYLLEEFQIPRRAKYSKSIELHGFCDASENAYAACIYIRSVSEKEIDVHLLCSKARVAPLQK